jgi:putative cell wall-binding protein
VTKSGTVGYTAPEVLDGQPPTPAADIYGFAATLLALLTGRPPGDVRPPWDGIDPTTVEVVERGLRPGLALEPQRRPASARELVERMRAWAGPEAQQAALIPPAAKVRTHVRMPEPGGRRRLALRAGLTVLAVAVVAGGIAGAVAMGRSPHSPVQRLQGPDRYSTAAQVAVHTFGHADVAVLARGDDLGDAIAGSYLAGAQTGGPILLTPQQGLPAVVLDALQRLKVKQVFIIGDATAVSGTVDTALQSAGMRTTRLAGVTRYGTAAVIEQAGGAAAKLGAFGPTALLVSSADLTDAIVAGPVSFHGRFPLLYTSADAIPPETIAALQEGAITHVVLVGSADQIGNAVVSKLAELKISSERVDGAGDPSSDSVAMAHFEQQTLHWPLAQVDLVRGDQGAVDGVATIANAGSNVGALLMTANPNELGAPVSGFLAQQAGRARQLVVVGDLTTITASTESAAAKALQLHE